MSAQHDKPIPKTTPERVRWREEARALIMRLIPGADEARINVAVHSIVDHLDMVWRGREKMDFTRWRGSLDHTYDNDLDAN